MISKCGDTVVSLILEMTEPDQLSLKFHTCFQSELQLVLLIFRIVPTKTQLFASPTLHPEYTEKQLLSLKSYWS